MPQEFTDRSPLRINRGLQPFNTQLRETLQTIGRNFGPVMIDVESKPTGPFQTSAKANIRAIRRVAQDGPFRMTGARTNRGFSFFPMPDTGDGGEDDFSGLAGITDSITEALKGLGTGATTSFTKTLSFTDILKPIATQTVQTFAQTAAQSFAEKTFGAKAPTIDFVTGPGQVGPGGGTFDPLLVTGPLIPLEAKKPFFETVPGIALLAGGGLLALKLAKVI